MFIYDLTILYFYLSAKSGKPFRVKSDMKRHITSHSRENQMTITDASGNTTIITKKSRGRKDPADAEKPKAKNTKKRTKSLVAVNESGEVLFSENLAQDKSIINLVYKLIF